MLEAYKKFWSGYVDFYGRSTRSDYWWVVLINGVILAALFLGMTYLGQVAGYTLTVFILFIVVIALPTISLQIRRLRDAGFNVAWILLKGALVTTVILWVMYLFPSKDKQ